MLTRNKQRGWTLLGWMLALAIVGAVGSISVKLVPHYVDNRTFVSVLESLPKDKVHSMSKTEIRSSITKRLKINNIRDMDLREVLKIERARGSTTLVMDYQRIEHLIGNVDLLLTFKRNFVFVGAGSR